MHANLLNMYVFQSEYFWNDGKGYVSTDVSSVSNKENISSEDLKLNAISKTKSSVYKGYVICPNEDCNEHCMLNSDEKVIECKNCGRWSNITYLELFPLSNSEDMNRQSLMNELKKQQEKIDRAEKMKKPLSATPVKGKKESSLRRTPMKRKKKFSDNSSAKRVQTHRAQLDNEIKVKIQEDNTKQHKTRRANLDNETKIKIQEDDTKQHKTRRANLDNETKIKIQDVDTKKHEIRQLVNS